MFPWWSWVVAQLHVVFQELQASFVFLFYRLEEEDSNEDVLNTKPDCIKFPKFPIFAKSTTTRNLKTFNLNIVRQNFISFHAHMSMICFAIAKLQNLTNLYPNFCIFAHDSSILCKLLYIDRKHKYCLYPPQKNYYIYILDFLIKRNHVDKNCPLYLDI